MTMTQTQQAAVQLNEWFETLMAAGFTEDQALHLIAYVIVEQGVAG